jgi:hypothetical protein
MTTPRMPRVEGASPGCAQPRLQPSGRPRPPAAVPPRRRPVAETRAARGSGSRASAPRGKHDRTPRSSTDGGASRGGHRLPRRGQPWLRSQACAALVAAALEHRPAGARAHTRAEPVGAGALALLGLVGALHGFESSECRSIGSMPAGQFRAPVMAFPAICAIPFRRPLSSPARASGRHIDSPRQGLGETRPSGWGRAQDPRPHVVATNCPGGLSLTRARSAREPVG